jgi:hypothetical protein
VEKRHDAECQDNSDDPRGGEGGTRLATFLGGDVGYRSHDAVEFVSTTTGGAFALLVVVALVALGLLFRLFLKSGADGAQR